MAPGSLVEALDGSSSMERMLTTEPLSQPSSTLSNRRSRWGERLVLPLVEGQHSITSVVHEDELSMKRYKNFRRGRSSSTCRYNKPTFQRKHNAEWRCIVCYLWNLRGKDHCSRCGASEGVDKIGNSVRQSEPLFTPRTKKVKPTLTKEFIWPPLFDTNGSDYVFDPRSNMFYEPKSDFFYDCHSKLYYSNKKKSYFRRVEDVNGVIFKKLSETNDAVESAAPLPILLSVNPAQAPMATEERKKSIAIHIRSKSLSRPRDNSRSLGRQSLSHAQGEIDETLDVRKKEQIQNIEKWKELSLKSTLMRSRDIALAVSDIVPQLIMTSTTTNNSVSMEPIVILDRGQAISAEKKDGATEQAYCPVVTAKSGQPICLLCKRKFISFEQLQRHEEISDLHKTNLAKRKAEQLTIYKDPQDTAKYEDRAKKRRHLHADVPILLPNKRLDEWRLAERADVIDPEVALGHHNVGNQLFQKMLAKTSTASHPSQVQSRRLCETIKEDWRRIESRSNTKLLSRDLQVERMKGIGW